MRYGIVRIVERGYSEVEQAVVVESHKVVGELTIPIVVECFVFRSGEFDAVLSEHGEIVAPEDQATSTPARTAVQKRGAMYSFGRAGSLCRMVKPGMRMVCVSVPASVC